MHGGLNNETNGPIEDHQYTMHRFPNPRHSSVRLCRNYRSHVTLDGAAETEQSQPAHRVLEFLPDPHRLLLVSCPPPRVQWPRSRSRHVPVPRQNDADPHSYQSAARFFKLANPGIKRLTYLILLPGLALLVTFPIDVKVVVRHPFSLSRAWTQVRVRGLKLLR